MIAGPVDPAFPNHQSTCYLNDWSGWLHRPAANVSDWLDKRD